MNPELPGWDLTTADWTPLAVIVLLAAVWLLAYEFGKRAGRYFSRWKSRRRYK